MPDIPAWFHTCWPPTFLHVSHCAPPAPYPAKRVSAKPEQPPPSPKDWATCTCCVLQLESAFRCRTTSMSLLRHQMQNAKENAWRAAEARCLLSPHFPSDTIAEAISHAQPTIAHKYQCAGASNPGGGGGWQQAARMHETMEATLCAKGHSSHTDDIAPLALSCMMVLLHITQHLTISFNSSNE